MSLALAIVGDGEGAQRVIEIEVRGAPSDRAADQIARTIANSPLVKTAFAGADPNWGRILAAAGRSGVKFNSGAPTSGSQASPSAAAAASISFDERAATRKCSRSTFRFASICTPARRRAYLDLRFHQNTSTSTPATARKGSVKPSLVGRGFSLDANSARQYTLAV